MAEHHHQLAVADRPRGARERARAQADLAAVGGAEREPGSAQADQAQPEPAPAFEGEGPLEARILGAGAQGPGQLREGGQALGEDGARLGLVERGVERAAGVAELGEEPELERAGRGCRDGPVHGSLVARARRAVDVVIAGDHEYAIRPEAERSCRLDQPCAGRTNLVPRPPRGHVARHQHGVRPRLGALRKIVPQRGEDVLVDGAGHARRARRPRRCGCPRRPQAEVREVEPGEERLHGREGPTFSRRGAAVNVTDHFLRPAVTAVAVSLIT